MEIPSNKFSYRLRAADSKRSLQNIPRYAFLNNTNNTDVSAMKQCVVEFDIPADLDPSVLFYYKLTNFFQNHRRYVKSLNSNQLKGKFVSPSSLDNSDCKPLGTVDGKAIYPCGLIANSLFNGWVYTFLSDIPPCLKNFYRYFLISYFTESCRFIRPIPAICIFLDRYCMARRSQKIHCISHWPEWLSERLVNCSAA